MRLIRSVCRPANIGLSPRFQRRQDTQIPTASRNPVVADASNLGHVSSILGCDRLYASASAATSALEDGKPQKRPSKVERRTMVEIYVNEYRMTNNGKFPPVTLTRKEVGGGYYVIRQIMSEMIYNSKQSSPDSKYIPMDESATKKNDMAYNSKKPIDFIDIYSEKSATENHERMSNSEELSMYTMDISLEKSTVKEDEISPKFEEVPQNRELGEGARSILNDIENSSSMISRSKQDLQSFVSVEVSDETKESNVKEDEISPKFEEVPETRELVEGARPISNDIENSSSMISQSKQDQQSFVSVETDEPKDVGVQFHHLIDKPESSGSQNLDHEKEHQISEDKVMSNASEHKAEPLKSTEISGRESQEVPDKYEGSPEKSSMWNNLKSFANGIFSMWKRS